MKSRKRIIIVLAVLMVLSMTGSVFAYMYRQSQIVTNNFEAAKVTCKVEEEFTQNQKTSVTVKNTGNIPSYIRVRMVSYWINSSGETVGKPSVMPVVSVADGWIKDEANNTYYYTGKVSPDSYTPELLQSGTTIVLTTDAEEGYNQVLEIFAEAIQAEPAAAAANAWGVTIDSSGNITAVN